MVSSYFECLTAVTACVIVVFAKNLFEFKRTHDQFEC